ncbi:MAG: hypothetical protein ISS49_00330 [Anaerolineae bacterium]|nr:hypothetical protein [Anaerolineae bacterium]
MSDITARQRHLLTQIAMPLVEIFKSHDLDSYSGTVLRLLTGRRRPYSGDEMAHFLLSGVQVGWGEALTADVASWATQLWATDDAQAEDTAMYVYWDWHVKAVYSDYHVPRTKHGTSDRIVGARKQLMLHDEAGHLLFLRTYRGDTHLIDGMIGGTAYYEGLAESRRLTHQIFDREGLSVAHFKELLTGEHERQFVTCLKSNQYDSLDSFESCSSFKPYQYDKDRNPIQEIAEAKYEMVEKGEEPRLFAIITSNWEAAATEIADLYRARQSKQENAIRDWWLPLGGDVNVGYDVHSFRIVPHLARPYAVAYWTALHHYGYTEQIPDVIFIATTAARGSATLTIEELGLTYRFVTLAPHKFFGHHRLWIEGQEIAITDRAKTVIGCLDHPEHCGGVVEAAKGLCESLSEEHVSPPLLTEYAGRMQNRAIFKRLGYLAELLGLPVGDEIARWRAALSTEYSLLDPLAGDHGPYNSRWQLRLNRPPADLTDWLVH